MGGPMKMLCGVVALAALGCGADPPRTITADDVAPIPPGTAIGTLFSGEYVVTSQQVDDCRCRRGSCATLVVHIGDILTVVQTDGALQISYASTQDTVSGGIDADGTFRCAGSQNGVDAVSNGLVHGQFHAANAVPTRASYVTELTLTTPLVDCDLRGSSTAQFTAPTAALAAAGGRRSDGQMAGFFGVVDR